MFSIPIMKSKLIMPQNSEYYIKSPRIIQLCNQMNGMRVVEITAPMGYGKTSFTIAALQGHTSKNRICWYHLDQHDNNLSLFYSHLIETLFPSELKQYLSYRKKFIEFGDIESQTLHINRLLCNSLYECTQRQMKTKHYLVFDDFHTVAENPEIQAAVRLFIDNFPNNFIFIIISRTKSNIITEKQILENNILRIDYSALSLKEYEVNQLSSKICGKIYEDNASIIDVTDGWPSGVLMMLQYKSKGPADNYNGLNSDYETARISTFNYIAHELLNDMNPDLLHFLLGISVLEEFSEESANYVLGINNSLHYIKACETNGLFLQKIIGTNVTYRFHTLFRNTLQKIRQEQWSNEEIAQSNLSAAEYFRSKQSFGKAIEYYLDANRVDLAAEMISNAGQELVSLEAMGKLRLLFDILQKDVLETNPVLMYMKSFLYQNGEEEAMNLLKKAYFLFEQAGFIDMELNTLFSLLAYYLFKNDAVGANDVLEQGCEKINQSEQESYQPLLKVFQFVKAIWSGEHKKADTLLRQVTLEELPPDYIWAIYMYSCIHYLIKGNLKTAENYIVSASDMKMINQVDMLKGFCQMFQTILSFYRNNTLQFEASSKPLAEISNKYNVLYMQAFTRIFNGFYQYRQNNKDNACTLIQSGINSFEQLGNYGLASVYSLYLFLYQTAYEKKTGLYEQAQKIYHALLQSPSGFLFPELGEMLLGAIAAESQQTEAGETLLLHAMQTAVDKSEKLLQTTISMNLANLYDKTGKTAEYEKFLRQAFLIASSNRYFVFTGILPETLVKLAVLAVRHNIYRDYVYDLISENYGIEKKNYFIQFVMMEDSSNSFAAQFITYCYHGTNPLPITISVRFFGSFELQINSKTVPKSKYITKKNESILKHLLLNKQKQISKEYLIELFWPDSDKRSGYASLRNAIYGIRKIFAQYGISDVRESFITENNGCLQIEHPEFIISDVDQFVKLEQDLKADTTDANKVTILEKLTGMYNGNLLENDVYEEWAFFEREEYKTIYINAVTSLCNLYSLHKDFKRSEKALMKALSIDPYNEDLNLLLLKNYVMLKQPERAMTFYKNYKNMLKRDLDLEPDIKLKDFINNMA